MELLEASSKPQTKVDPGEEMQSSASEQMEENSTEQATPSLTDQGIQNPKLASPEVQNEDKESEEISKVLD